MKSSQCLAQVEVYWQNKQVKDVEKCASILGSCGSKGSMCSEFHDPAEQP